MQHTLVIGPGIIVRRSYEFLVDPGEEPDGRIREAVCDRLRLGGHHGKITKFLLADPQRGADLVTDIFVEGHGEQF